MLNRGQRGKILLLLATWKGAHVKQLCNTGIPKISIKSHLKDLIYLGLITERFFIYSITQEGADLSQELLRDPTMRIWLEQLTTYKDISRPKVEYLE